MNLDVASKQWATRPADERYATLDELQTFLETRYRASREITRDLSTIRAVGLPDGDVRLEGSRGQANLTHHSFNQLASMATLSGDTLRSAIEHFVNPAKASAWVADGINMGLEGRVHEIQTTDTRKSRVANILFQLPNNEQPGSALVARSFNTEKYSRIWDLNIVAKLMRPLWEEGFTNPPAMDGPAGLYASDRDMFILAAPQNVARINMPGVRSEDSSLGGFQIGDQTFYPFIIAQNSEVGGGQMARFMGGLLQEICGNHILWGARDVVSFSVKHVAAVSNPDGAWNRLHDGFMDFLRDWTKAGTLNERQTLQAAMEFHVAKDKNTTVEFLTDKGWSQKAAKGAIEVIEKGDLSTGILDQDVTRLFNIVAALTAMAREMPHQDNRVLFEQKATKLLKLVQQRRK